MSEADWIASAVSEWGLGRIEVRERAALLKILRQAYATHCASMTQLKEMAEGIVEHAECCIECCLGTYEGFRSDDLRQYVFARLAPLYAELERLRAENVQVLDLLAKRRIELDKQGDWIDRMDADIDRMRKLLVDARKYVSYRHMQIEDDTERRAAYACLESIDRETRGK